MPCMTKLDKGNAKKTQNKYKFSIGISSHILFIWATGSKYTDYLNCIVLEKRFTGQTYNKFIQGSLNMLVTYIRKNSLEQKLNKLDTLEILYSTVLWKYFWKIKKNEKKKI